MSVTEIDGRASAVQAAAAAAAVNTDISSGNTHVHSVPGSPDTVARAAASGGRARRRLSSITVRQVVDRMENFGVESGPDTGLASHMASHQSDADIHDDGGSDTAEEDAAAAAAALAPSRSSAKIHVAMEHVHRSARNLATQRLELQHETRTLRLLVVRKPGDPSVTAAFKKMLIFLLQSVCDKTPPLFFYIFFSSFC